MNVHAREKLGWYSEPMTAVFDGERDSHTGSLWASLEDEGGVAARATSVVTVTIMST